MIEIPEVLIQDKRSNRTTIALYVFLRDNDGINKTYDQLAEEMKMSRATIGVNMKLLQELGLVAAKRTLLEAGDV